MSDSSGYVLEKDGFTQEKLEKVMYLKNVKRGRISEYLKVNQKANFNSRKHFYNNVSPYRNHQRLNSLPVKNLGTSKTLLLRSHRQHKMKSMRQMQSVWLQLVVNWSLRVRICRQRKRRLRCMKAMESFYVREKQVCVQYSDIVSKKRRIDLPKM